MFWVTLSHRSSLIYCHYYSDIAVEDYFLLVESLDTEVVAFAPMLASHHPRVIAVGEGNGNLLRVTLLLSEECRMRRGAGNGGNSGSSSGSSKQNKPNASPLASALASIEVDFNNVDMVSKQESIQNDGTVGRERKNYRNNGDLADIIGELGWRIFTLNLFNLF